MDLLAETACLREESRRVSEKFREVAAAFVEIELDLAITFYKIALCSGDIGRSRRNLTYASRALTSAKRFSRHIGDAGLPHRRIAEKFDEAAAAFAQIEGGR